MKICDFEAAPRTIRDVAARCNGESFFNLPEWFGLVARYGSEPGSRTGLALPDDARLGFAFCRLPRERILRSCTNLYTCDFAVLGDRSSECAVGDFIGELACSFGPLDGLQFEGFDPADRMFPVLVDGIRSAGFAAKAFFCWANWFESTSGMDFERYIATRPSVLRHTWKRKTSQLSKSQAAFRFYTGATDPEPLITLYERLREDSWKSAEPYPAFVPNLVRLASRLGALRFGVLEIGGEAAAAQFWIVWESRATIFKLVHAERFAVHSPGTLLTMEMLRNVLEDDRPSEVDFGRGDDAYKKLWLRSRRERWGIEAANSRTLRGRIRGMRIELARSAARLRRSGASGDRNPHASSPGSARTAEADRPRFRPS